MLTLLNLLSAVALLIWGTHIVRTGILRVYGSNLRHVIGQNMSKRWLAFVAGILVTAMVQSSNATAMLVTSFVGQGLHLLHRRIKPQRLLTIGFNVNAQSPSA